MMEPGLSPHGFDSDQIVVYKLGQIESKLEAIDKKLDTKERAQDEEIKLLKADVSKLKHSEALRMGAAAAISFVIGILTKVVPWQNLL